MVSNKEDITNSLNTLLKEKKIRVAYPRNIDIESLSSDFIDDLWFGLNDTGKYGWEQIKF